MCETWVAESRIEPISGAFETLLGQMKFTKPKAGENLAAKSYAVAPARRDPDGDLQTPKGLLLLSTETRPNSPSGICALRRPC
ncbi:MAG: hypothetical protein IPJ30_23965 [Acidobacteria bacterium]|nr:hypothetical protein [Acidobacteriota bacterium]